VPDTLKSVIITSETYINYAAFYGCSSIESIVIPDCTEGIAYNAFYGCSSLKDIVIPDGVAKIGGYTFGNCTSLASVVIPDSVTSIEEDAFYNCSALTSITFEGTTAQWQAITKGTDWSKKVPATNVVCSDGTASLN
jgi:hypothetical protein